MDTDDRRVGRNLRQAGTNTVAARRTTGNCMLATGVGGGNNNDYPITRGCRRRNAPVEHASIAECFVLLGATEALPDSTRNNDRPHRFAVWPK